MSFKVLTDECAQVSKDNVNAPSADVLRNGVRRSYFLRGGHRHPLGRRWPLAHRNGFRYVLRNGLRRAYARRKRRRTCHWEQQRRLGSSEPRLSRQWQNPKRCPRWQPRQWRRCRCPPASVECRWSGRNRCPLSHRAEVAGW